MKSKEEILKEIFEELPEIERALDSDQLNTIVSVHDSIKFKSDIHRDKDNFREFPFLRDHIAKFNLPDSKKMIKTILSHNFTSHNY
jgi:hypothetical protein